MAKDIEHYQVQRSKDAAEANAEIVATTKRKRGQPTKRSDAVTQELWARLASGERLIDICADPHMPARITLKTWEAEDPALREYLNTARQDKAEYLAEAMEAMADGDPRFSTGNVERDKLKFQVFKWLASKYHRTYFGDNIQLDVKSEAIVINLPPEFAQPVIDMKSE